MVINDLCSLSVFSAPFKAYSPLVVDENAMLPLAVALQRFKPLAGRLHMVAARPAQIAAATREMPISIP